MKQKFNKDGTFRKPDQRFERGIWLHAEEIISRYEKGMSLRDLVKWIRETYDIQTTYETVRHLLLRNGVILRGVGNYTKTWM